MRHRHHSPVVDLFYTRGFTIDGITGTTGAVPIGATTLDHKVRDHPVKSKSVVKSLADQFPEISHCNGGRNTGGSQFFICHNRSNTKHLDGVHTCFGKVTEGLDVVDDIRGGDVIEKIILT